MTDVPQQAQQPSDQPSDSANEQRMRLEALEEEANRAIRRVWHKGQWYFSIIDAIALLTGSANPRRYWSDMKRDVADEGFREVYALSVQLKMRAPDGRERLTDAANAETLLRLIQSVRSTRAEPFKRWLARVGAERLEEIESPQQAADRLYRLYKARGYDDSWINARLQSIVARDELTDEWRDRGAHEGREFALLTEILQHGVFEISTAEHRAIKAISPRENLRDSMTTLELALTTLAEATATELHRTHDAHGLNALSADAHEAGDVGGAARKDVEARLGRPVVSAENHKSLTQPPQRQPSLFEPFNEGSDETGSEADEPDRA